MTCLGENFFIFPAWGLGLLESVAYCLLLVSEKL